jgi:hypothetical protein
MGVRVVETKNGLADKARRALRARAAGKRCYARYDALLDEIAAEIEPGETILLNEFGKKAVLRDQFDGKLIVWKPCGIRRYELEEELEL